MYKCHDVNTILLSASDTDKGWMGQVQLAKGTLPCPEQSQCLVCK